MATVINGNTGVDKVQDGSITSDDLQDGSRVLASYTVSGSAVTSIDFSGLDINAHGGSYEIEIRLLNNSATPSSVSMYINNNTTATNYYCQYYGGDGASTSASRSNTARITDLSASLATVSFIQLSLFNSKIAAASTSVVSMGTTVQGFTYNVTNTFTATNITQITFTASVASALAVGSKIIIRRKDK